MATWNSLEITKVLFSVLTPLTVLFLGWWVNLQLRRMDTNQNREREERKRIEDMEREQAKRRYEEQREIERLEREEKRNELERKYEPHVEFNIQCEFFGPRDGQYLADFVLVPRNCGQVLHRFRNITLRVRGIKKGEAFDYWPGRKPRANFPHKIIETEIVPPDWNYIFIEPGTEQRINLTSIVPVEYSFILVWAEFRYDKYTPHSVERVFAVAA